MIRYKNAYKSGIQFYEILENGISLNFGRNGWYTYTSEVNSSFVINRMKSLAIKGRELNTFINRNNPIFL